MSQLKVGINGFGRIGRLLFRQAFKNLSIVAVNGRSQPDMAAHLLKYDSVHGPWDKSVSCSENALLVEDKKVAWLRHFDPSKIPWQKHGVNVVVECTGAFKAKEDLQKHLIGGSVKKVIVAAPAEGADISLVFGVNHLKYNPRKHHLISLSSCTTNCLAPLLSVLHKSFGLSQAFVSTVHAYTKDQMLLDSSHKSDFRRARAGALNITPTKTGAGKAIEKVLPELKGRIQALALRVPVPNVSLVDLSARTEKTVTLKNLSQSFQKAAETEFKNIMAFETASLVSSDFIGRRESTIIDAPALQVLEDRFVKVLSWYDNEAGFSERIIDFINFLKSH